MLITWLILITIQWNTLHETLKIKKAPKTNYLLFTFAITFELLISLIFTYDLHFRFTNQIPLYSKAYLLMDVMSGPISFIIDILSLIIY
jgi:hypothetical protein